VFSNVELKYNCTTNSFSQSRILFKDTPLYTIMENNNLEVISVCFFCPISGQDIHSSLKFCPVRKFCLSSGQKSSQNERYLSGAISCWSLNIYLIFFYDYRL